MKFEDDFARRHPNGVEKQGGSIFIAVDIAREFIDEAERQCIGILGMDGFLIGEFMAYGQVAEASESCR
jgi:hypothetical protein